MRNDKHLDLGAHRKRNSKTIKRIATGRRSTKRAPVISTIAVIGVILLCAGFITLNDSVLHLKGVPTWSELFGGAGLTETATPLSGSDVTVHFIDVGQGDCELIVTPEKTMLIDGGEKEYGNTVIEYLKALGITKLDYLVTSHPHSDHIGADAAIVKEFSPATVIMPELTDDMVPTTSCYTKLLDAMEKQDCELKYAVVGEALELGGEARVEFLAPVKDYEDLNNYSIVMKLIHGSNSFLFCGDVESDAEGDVLDSGADITADVLKVAHHGSSTSSTKKFLKATGAKYAVIEVGSPNSYNHPNDGTLSRLEKQEMQIYRTDKNGSIVFTSDGAALSVRTEKE